MAWRKAVLTILDTATDSEWLDLGANGARRSVNLTITAPAGLTGTITVQKADDTSGTRTGTLQSPAGTDINIASSKSVPLLKVTATAIRLHSSAAEVGNKVFSVEGAAAR